MQPQVNYLSRIGTINGDNPILSFSSFPSLSSSSTSSGGGGAEDAASELKVVSENITVLYCRISVRVLLEMMMALVLAAAAAAPPVLSMVAAAVAS